MNHIKYVFFDLDRTLWDFNRSSVETLGELFADYHARIGRGISFDQFLACYQHNNELLWRRYERSEVKPAELRVQRWMNTFRELGVETGGWTEQMGKDYLHVCPRKPYLVEGARELLDYLADGYEVHMITNGMTDTQLLKLEHSGISGCFGEVITSDGADAKKPDQKIFDFALGKTGASREHCLYVGDDYASDVRGGMNAGWDVVFYNPEALENPVNAPQIKALRELSELL